jgi:hypothetical protein
MQVGRFSSHSARRPERFPTGKELVVCNSFPSLFPLPFLTLKLETYKELSLFWVWPQRFQGPALPFMVVPVRIRGALPPSLSPPS